MPKKLLFACLLLAAVSACSGEGDTEYGSECVQDSDCEKNGAVCKRGYCMGGENIEPSTDGGSATVDVDGQTDLPEGTENPVTVMTPDCTGTKCEIEPGSDVTFTAAMWMATASTTGAAAPAAPAA
jgi:hypothetical protein